MECRRLEWGRGWWAVGKSFALCRCGPPVVCPLNIEEPQARTQKPKLPTLPLTVGGKPGWQAGAKIKETHYFPVLWLPY